MQYDTEALLHLKPQEDEEEESVDEDCNMIVGKLLLFLLFVILVAGLLHFTLKIDVTAKAGRPYQAYDYNEVLSEGYYKNGKQLSVEARLVLAVMRETRRNSEELKVLKDLFRKLQS